MYFHRVMLILLYERIAQIPTNQRRMPWQIQRSGFQGNPEGLPNCHFGGTTVLAHLIYLHVNELPFLQSCLGLWSVWLCNAIPLLLALWKGKPWLGFMFSCAFSLQFQGCVRLPPSTCSHFFSLFIYRSMNQFAQLSTVSHTKVLC